MRGRAGAVSGALWLLAMTCAHAQEPSATKLAPDAAAAIAPSPIAIIPVDANDPDKAAVVTGALEVTAGRALIATSGTVTSGSQTTDVTLPRRGRLRVCASTTVKLAVDTSVPSGAPNLVPGLLMAMDHGAVEMSFADRPGQETNADVLMTPDFRILISGPGASEVKVRLGREGDTCVDNSGIPGDGSSSLGGNSGKDAPYVVVTSLFDKGLYRVQSGQRVMFQHGSLSEVVDQEKEPCGCPPAEMSGNEFPLAQSEGLAPLAPPAPAPAQKASAATLPPLLYQNTGQAAPEAVGSNTAPAANITPAPAVSKQAAKKRGVFTRIGHFFRRIFGAE
jgi:hypothetical protein